MRQLKTLMRNIKKDMLACGPCECRTLQCWRYANENCGCGESNGGLQPGNKTYVSGASTDMHIKLFATAPDGEDYIDIGGVSFVTSGIFDSEGGDALVEILSSSYTTGGSINNRFAPFILGTDGSFPTDGAVGTIKAEAMSLVKAVLNNPTEANEQNLINAIDASIDAIIGQGDVSASFVTYDNIETTITIAEHVSNVAIGTEQSIAAVVVSPNSETITVTSSDPSLLTVRTEKIVDSPLNAYTIYGVGLQAGAVTVTVTGVNNPIVSASFSTEIGR